MSGSTLKEVVFKGRNNPNTFQVKEDGAEIDLSAVTRFVLYLPAIDFTVDTTSKPGSIVGDAQGNVTLDFKGGAVDLSGVVEAEHYARLTAYDPGHVDGQILIHEDRTNIHDRLLLAFVDAGA